VIVLMRRRDDLWWRYVLLATLLVPVPAALTVDRYNAIRLAALPVLLLVLAIPALDALVKAALSRNVAPVAAAVLGVAVALQFVQFLYEYRTRGPARSVLFDAGVPALLDRAFANGSTIYIDYDDRDAQAQARWHAAESGLPRDRVQILPNRRHPTEGQRGLRAVSGVRLRLYEVRPLGELLAREGDRAAFRLTGAGRAGASVKPEDLFKWRRTAVGHALLEQFRHRVLPSLRNLLLREELRGGLEIVGLEVAEHLISVAEDRVVPDTGAAKGVEHLRPYLSMRPDVLADSLGTHLKDECAALCHVVSFTTSRWLTNLLSV
jgi:hypothetical protein